MTKKGGPSAGWKRVGNKRESALAEGLVRLVGDHDNVQAGVMMHAYFRDEWKLVRTQSASGGRRTATGIRTGTD